MPKSLIDQEYVGQRYPMPRPDRLGCLALAACLVMAGCPASTKSRTPAVPRDTVTSMDRTPAPVFDVPRLENLKVDGDLSDWGKAGLQIDALAGADQLASKPSAFDARLRLGWNDAGLLLAVRVHDLYPQESDNDEFLYGGDAIQIYVADKVNGAERYQLVLTPGMDPRHPTPRSKLNDRRKNAPTLPPLAPTYKFAKTSDGYAAEVLLPWTALGVTPKEGGEAALQVFVATSDPGRSETLIWYPSVATGNDWTKMQRLRLARQAGAPVCAAVMVEERELRERTARVTAVADWTGRPVQVWHNGRLAAAEPLQSLNDRAQAELTIPLPKPGEADGPVVVTAGGEVLAVVQFADLDGRRKRAFVDQNIVFRPGVFSSERFPSCDFEDPSLVRRLIGPYELRTLFYNARYEKVTIAAEPGRYGALVEVVPRTGKPITRYCTLYRTPGPVDWRGEAIQCAVTFPETAGVASGAVRRHGGPTSALLGEWLSKGMLNDRRGPTLLAGLHELPAEGPAVNTAEDAWALDRQWWVGLKRQRNGNAGRFAQPLVCPRPGVGPSAPILREGTLDEAGLTEPGMARVDKVLKEWEADSHEAFAVGIARHGIIAWHKAYGMRDGKPMTVETPSPMASVTKLMSGTLVMMLVDQGRVDLDAPVETYLPELRGVAANKPLCVWHCFTHTNGLWEMGGDHASDWEETVAWMLPEATVGRWPSYGSAGPSTGGKIIEAVSGEALPIYYQRHLLGPLGMTRTHVTGTFGDARSVPLDMLRLGQMLVNRGTYGGQRFFTPATLEEMLPRDWGARLDSGRKWVWGIGCRWMTDEMRDTKIKVPEEAKVFGHQAASSAIFMVDLTNDLVIVMTRARPGKDYDQRRAGFVKAVYEALANGK